MHKHGGRLEKVVRGVLENIPRDRILVVDDASPENARGIAKATGVHWIRSKTNRGKGAALQAGYRYWAKQGISYVISLDGDGQHDPAEIPSFFQHPEVDLLIGSRRRQFECIPWDRRFSNLTTSWLLSKVTGQDIEDSQCGYRRVRLSAMQGIKFHERGFAFESEMILRFAKKKRSIQFVPVNAIYDGEPSSMNRLTDTIKFICMVRRTLAEHD